MKYVGLLAALCIGGCSKLPIDPHESLPKSSPLVAAVRKQDLVEISHLIESKADVNGRVWPNETPLTQAIFAKQYDIVELLLQGGANPNTIWDGNGPLETAVYAEDLRLVKMLLAHGASLTRKGAGKSALAVAAEKGNLEIAEVLLTAGADVNDQDSSGNTPLIEAVRKNNLPFVKYLMKHGADPNLAGEQGPPLEQANRYPDKPDPEMIAYLQKVAKPVDPGVFTWFNQDEYHKKHPERLPEYKR